MYSGFSQRASTDKTAQIEFPSILLPPDIHSGSIVDVDVSRNFEAEKTTTQQFEALQDEILKAFGAEEPSAPVLRCRNATQTSIVLEWDPITVATSDLRSLSLYRNGNKAGSIPKPTEKSSTKISGLAVDTEYTFSLVLRTSAGTYSSERLTVRTHKMTDLSGITVTPGVMAPELRKSLEESIQRMGAKLSEQVRIDTTHFVCTEARGDQWKRAAELNIPVVVPDWVKACEHDGRIMGVRAYYLDADPKLRKIGPAANLQRQESSQSLARTVSNGAPTPSEGTPKTQVTPPTPDKGTKAPQGGENEDEDEDEDEDERPVPPPKDAAHESQGENEAAEDDSVTTKVAKDEHADKALEGSPGPVEPTHGADEDEDEDEDGSGMEDVKL